MLYSRAKLILQSAQDAAQQSWAKLVQMSAHYASGTLVGYEMLSRQAYLASYDIKTLAQSMDWARMGSQEHVLRLLDAGAAVFERAAENENAHRVGALARSQAFFDDLLDAQDMLASLILVPREAHSTAEVESPGR